MHLCKGWHAGKGRGPAGIRLLQTKICSASLQLKERAKVQDTVKNELVLTGLSFQISNQIFKVVMWRIIL